jgi:hypothetical protein
MDGVDTETGADKTTTIRMLNDNFRTTMKGGNVVMTRAVAELPTETLLAVMQGVRAFGDFSEDNDPNGEHDFGNFKVGDLTIWFKIDYYSKDMESGSEDPADPEKTTRVLTVLFPEDY